MWGIKPKTTKERTRRANENNKSQTQTMSMMVTKGKEGGAAVTGRRVKCVVTKGYLTLGGEHTIEYIGDMS